MKKSRKSPKSPIADWSKWDAMRVWKDLSQIDAREVSPENPVIVRPSLLSSMVTLTRMQDVRVLRICAWHIWQAELTKEKLEFREKPVKENVL